MSSINSTIKLMLLFLTLSEPTVYVDASGDCGQSFRPATETPQNLTSPNFPEAYPRNIICTWWISSLYLYSDIHIEFKHLDLEDSNNCENDNLTMYQYYNGIEQIVQVCGNETMHEKLVLGRDVKIVLKTNNNTEGSGFVLQYYMVDDDSSERDDYHPNGYTDHWGTAVLVVFVLTLVTLIASIAVACYCQRKQSRARKNSCVQEVHFSGFVAADDDLNKTHI
ncbi:tumor necrosis factor-inducible gene 6 protein-like [Mercenaria mercenaria]|uniref:tumor necrosis factor-inducible gene 6 protein-like n=1 Tax=Mercenaria mercenaria TaxID=6596 RepID=UPI00234E6F36|nr:tumor necrosis factor-inducible gene 6 protein-like [Mercenaria mercenaria]